MKNWQREECCLLFAPPSSFTALTNFSWSSCVHWSRDFGWFEEPWMMFEKTSLSWTWIRVLVKTSLSPIIALLTTICWGCSSSTWAPVDYQHRQIVDGDDHEFWVIDFPSSLVFVLLRHCYCHHQTICRCSIYCFFLMFLFFNDFVLFLSST